MDLLQAAAILESLAEGVLAVNAAARIVSVNPAARALLGLGSGPLVGTSLFEAVRQPEVLELVRAVLKSGKLSRKEFTFFSPRERVLRAQAVPCDAPGLDGARVVLVLQDVSEHHRYEELRREFVANVSHELKSPLTSIRSLTETLLDGGLEDPSCNERFVALIEEDAARLARLIDDLLILSQVESRAFPMRLATLDIVPEISSALAPLEVLIDQKSLHIEVDAEPGLTLRADPDRLRQVLHNLIDNAVKYSPEGATLRIGARPGTGDVEVWVSDEGPGIPPEALGRVFERFYRVDKNRSRELGGTGLGLSIVKHIVESHGGRVWVESAPGKGATFRFTLPVEAAEAQDVPRRVAARRSPAEDPEDELRRLQEHLVLMAGIVEEAVGRSVRALTVRDARLARQVVEGDRQIDQAEIAIDEICLHLLEHYRPDSETLRLIAMAFKINAELERMGDLAASIASRTLGILRAPLLHPLVDIQTMAEQVQQMVKDSLDALMRRDPELALEVCRRDDEVDRMNKEVYRAMLGQMGAGSQNVERAVSLLLIARALERIGDHATNIAENVVYLVRGHTIKHRILEES